MLCRGIRARGIQVPPDLVAQALVDIRRRPAGHEHEVLHAATEIGGQLPGDDGAERVAQQVEGGVGAEELVDGGPHLADQQVDIHLLQHIDMVAPMQLGA